MKKISKKEMGKKKSKTTSDYDTFDKVVISAAVVMILIALALFYNLGTVGKAVAAPAPLVDLTMLESEDLDLSSYDKMEIKLKLSGDQEVSEFTLNAEEDDGLTYYQFIQEANGEENVLAYGILSAGLGDSGSIYLNDDKIEDLKLTLQGNLLTVTNLNFLEPDVAEFEVYDEEFNKIQDDVLDVTLEEEAVFYLNVTSTSLPLVTVLIDGEETQVEEVDSGKDFVLVKLSFTAAEEVPYYLTVTADVGGKETTKEFILAVDGFVYGLAEEGYTVNLNKVDGDYEAVYELEKTSKLLPVSLLCGELGFAEDELAESIEKVLSYQKNTEQWKENVPSEFDKLELKKGYLFDLKEDILSFVVECDGKLLPQTPLLSLGWNLLGTNGYKATKVAGLKTAEGDIVGIYEYGNSEPLDLEELPSGKVYWVKVE